MTSGTTRPCSLCGRPQASPLSEDGYCPACAALAQAVQRQPAVIRVLWQRYHDEPILPAQPSQIIASEAELPEVLDGKRYRAIDRDRNKWYLSVSEVNGKPVEIFASTAFDRDHELQSRISNLTTITRLISLLLRHIFLGEPLTFDKCLKQIQRSSRQKNDLPDMLYGVLSRYQPPHE
ncbi:TSCPD domain-containing protein [Desulfobulbus propionicus]